MDAVLVAPKMFEVCLYNDHKRWNRFLGGKDRHDEIGTETFVGLARRLLSIWF